MEFPFGYSPAEVAKVRTVQFGILSPDEIRSMSVAEIMSGDTTEKGKPKVGGLSDRRLGTVDRKSTCETCKGTMVECPGHFGHLELAAPVFHIGFMRTLLTILRCVCFNCSKILVDKDDKKFKQALRIRNPKHRLKQVLHACKNKTKCEDNMEVELGGNFEESHKRSRSGCGAEQPKITIDGMRMIADYKAQRKRNVDQEHLPEPEECKQKLSAAKVLEIVRKISDEDCQLLGLNPTYARPDWMILQVLPIPPPAVRPSVMMDSSSRSEDDLTHQLAMIIRHNENLKSQEKRGAPYHVISEFTQLLQFYIATYFDNELPNQPRATQLSGRPIKSICSRLKAKEGRVRGNLMGKRVDFSARTVITPDPNINIDELGVPLSIASNLTYPETVTPYNIERLKKLVEDGPHPPPGKTGAKYIIRDDGKRLDLRYLKKSSDRHLEFGYKVERHLIDGDYVLFNRQPSLHKMSIMGHRIKIMPYSTFRLNLSVTAPYNADFDGDEMNMHVPQSFETRAEVSELMMVPKCIVSPQSNKPVMGIVQDTLLGCCKMTRRDTFIEKDLFMNILMWLEGFDWNIPAPAILKPRPLWTGKQVFSLITPKQINLVKYSAWHDENESGGWMTPGDTQVLIEKGELLSGTLCKKTLGACGGSLIHVIWQEVGPDAARKFLGQTQWVVNYWLLHNGFSIGIGDAIADALTMEKINVAISNAKDEVRDLIRQAKENKLEAKPGLTMKESFETRVNEVLNTARDAAGSSAEKSLSDSNNLKAMVRAGSKGSSINISQMIACVGQQNVEGKRIPFGFTDRTLPHFTKDDYGPESRGFVENSYLRGLNPQEFFFHAMGGREGLIDTAVKTSETGYIQRRLVKAMEDIMVKYDGTVRNSLGDVIQFLYGEDGMDAVWIESQPLDTLKMKKSDLYAAYRYEYEDENWTPNYIAPEVVKDLKTVPELHKVFGEEFRMLEADRSELAKEIAKNGDSVWPLPVNIERLIWNAQKIFCIDPSKCSDMHPLEIVDAVFKLQERLKVVHGDDLISKEAQENAIHLFKILIRSTLASKRVLQEYKLTREAFEWVIGEIESRFLQSLVSSGEMIGCIAAQSIGEPATQMTLNTFHYAGVSAKNVTLGVPRLREIINVAKNIKTPSLSVYLKPGANKTKYNAKKVQTALEYTTLGTVTQATGIWYDPDPMNTRIEEDQGFVEMYSAVPDEELDNVSPWVLRIELNPEKMVDKRLSIADVAERIASEFGDELSCIHSDDNYGKLILHIRVKNDEAPRQEAHNESAEDDVFLRVIESNLLTELALQGIPDIHKVFIKCVKTNKFDENEGFSAEEEWVLDTEGCNLLAVMCQEDVDATRTTSNHLIEILEVLGIEAARRALLDELRAVISFDGGYVNYRHLAILCDTMTYRGHLMAITRHGINRNDTGPLMRCSFEETVDILLDAAVYAETDHLKGVTENIMLGQLAPIGTGDCVLHLNTSMLNDSIELLDGDTDFGLTPSYSPVRGSPLFSPYHQSSPTTGAVFSPFVGGLSFSPGYCPSSPGYSPTSPTYSPNSPAYSPTSPAYSPESPSYSCFPTYSPTSPKYNPLSPSYTPTSPTDSPTSPTYNPSSPSYTPTSPTYSPTSPTYNPLSPSYTPTSPSYSPTSPYYSPTSPSYCPSSPYYSPTSPSYSPTSPYYSPTSPSYSPSSPNYVQCSTSLAYSPSRPGMSLDGSTSSQTYSPTSPAYSPSSPEYSPSSPTYSPSSPDSSDIPESDQGEEKH